MQRIESFVESGFCAMVPKYENGDLLVEPIDHGGAEIAASFSRAVSGEVGSGQIIECIEKGWDIHAFMGGWTCKDKINGVIDYFNQNPEKKPKKPIRIFGFSDACFMTILQSHLPDCVEFVACPTSSVFLKFKKEGVHDSIRVEYERQKEEVELLIRDNKFPLYERGVLAGDASLLENRRVQYYAYHHDNIWAETHPDKVKMPNGTDIYRLKTDGPYIISFDGFLQLPEDRKYFNGNTPKFLRDFLEEKNKVGQLPLIVEIGLFATRMDGDNGYSDLMHCEKTGLVLVNDSNVDKIFDNKAKLRDQIVKINEIREGFESGTRSDGDRGDVLEKLTSVPDLVNRKVMERKDYELTKSDIEMILEHENEKISKYIEEMVGVCRDFGVVAVSNHKYGHTANMGVIGGGEVKVNVKDTGVAVEFEYIQRGDRSEAAGVVEVKEFERVDESASNTIPTL